MVYPRYREQAFKRTIKLILEFLGVEQSDESAVAVSFFGDQLTLTFIIEYFILALMAVLIVFNVRGFINKLLVTLKNILRDNEIQISYTTTLLAFSFIMGAYYFSILLQMSYQLPEEKRKPFEYLLDKFSPSVVFYTFDCFFVVSSFLGAFLIWFNWLVKRVPK